MVGGIQFPFGKASGENLAQTGMAAFGCDCQTRVSG